MPPENEDLVWETWVPLEKEAAYLELQIWYSDNLLNSGPQDIGYLFQLELSGKGETAINGVDTTVLEVKSASRINALTLEIAD